MRISISLDDDVAALVGLILKIRNTTMKLLVNEALRHGLQRICEPRIPTAFRTQAIDLGKCYFPNFDKTWEVIAEADGTSYK